MEAGNTDNWLSFNDNSFRNTKAPISSGRTVRLLPPSCKLVSFDNRPVTS